MQNAVKGMVSGWIIKWVNPEKRYRATAECVEHLIYAGNCNLWYLGDLVQFLVVDGDSDVARLERIPRDSTKERWSVG